MASSLLAQQWWDDGASPKSSPREASLTGLATCELTVSIRLGAACSSTYLTLALLVQRSRTGNCSISGSQTWTEYRCTVSISEVLLQTLLGWPVQACRRQGED